MRFQQTNRMPYLNRGDQKRLLVLVGMVAMIVFSIEFAARPSSWYWLTGRPADVKPANSKQEKQKSTSNDNVRDETNVRLYHEHKKEIEKDFKDGGIDDENYQYLLAELDSSLLQDIEASETKADIAIGKEKKQQKINFLLKTL